MVITDAQPSLDEEQRRRKRTYAILMVVHIVGFAVGGALYHIWWLALAIVVATGTLPWVAVVIANDRSRPRQAERVPHEEHRTPRELPDDR